MFGSGFTVGVAVTRAAPAWAPGAPPGPAPAGAVGVAERPSRLGAVLPVDERDDKQIAADLATITGIEAALAAWRLQPVLPRRPPSTWRPAHTTTGRHVEKSPCGGVAGHGWGRRARCAGWERHAGPRCWSPAPATRTLAL